MHDPQPVRKCMGLHLCAFLKSASWYCGSPVLMLRALPGSGASSSSSSLSPLRPRSTDGLLRLLQGPVQVADSVDSIYLYDSAARVRPCTVLVDRRGLLHGA